MESHHKTNRLYKKKKKKKEARISLHAKKRRLHNEHLTTHKRLRFRNGTGT